MKIFQNRKTFKDVLYSLGGNLLPPVFGLVTMPLVLRQVGAERFGVFALLMACATYFAVFDLGVGRGTTFFVSKYIVTKPARAARILKVAARLQLLTGGVLLVVWGLLTPLLVNHWLIVPDVLKDETLHAFWITGASLPFVLGIAASKGALEGVERFDLANIIRVCTSFFVFSAPVLVSFFTPSMFWIALGMTLGRVAAYVAYELAVRRQLDCSLRLRKGLFWVYGRSLLGYGGWIMLAVVLGALMSMGYLDRFIVGSLIGLEAVAHYAIPSEMAVRILLVPGAVAGIFFSQAAKQKFTTKSVRVFTRQLYLYLLVGVVPLVLGGILFQRLILEVLMGDQYTTISSTVFLILLAGVFCNALAHAPYTLLQATGNPRPTALRHVVQLPFYVMISLFVTREYGVVGTAGAWLFWAVTDYLMLIVLSWKHSPRVVS